MSVIATTINAEISLTNSSHIITDDDISMILAAIENKSTSDLFEYKSILLMAVTDTLTMNLNYINDVITYVEEQLNQHQITCHNVISAVCNIRYALETKKLKAAKKQAFVKLTDNNHLTVGQVYYGNFFFSNQVFHKVTIIHVDKQSMHLTLQIQKKTQTQHHIISLEASEPKLFNFLQTSEKGAIMKVIDPERRRNRMFDYVNLHI